MVPEECNFISIKFHSPVIHHRNVNSLNLNDSLWLWHLWSLVRTSQASDRGTTQLQMGLTLRPLILRQGDSTFGPEAVLEGDFHHNFGCYGCHLPQGLTALDGCLIEAARHQPL